MQFDFQIPMAPVAKARPRFTRKGWSYKDKANELAEDNFATFLARIWAGKPPLDGPLELSAFFYILKPDSVDLKKRPYPIIKPDIDNYLKMLFDAGNSIVWFDDKQIVRLKNVGKDYDSTTRTYFSVRQMK